MIDEVVRTPVCGLTWVHYDWIRVVVSPSGVCWIAWLMNHIGGSRAEGHEGLSTPLGPISFISCKHLSIFTGQRCILSQLSNNQNYILQIFMITFKNLYIEIILPIWFELRQINHALSNIMKHFLFQILWKCPCSSPIGKIVAYSLFFWWILQHRTIVTVNREETM